jgi:hypothetical protein
MIRNPVGLQPSPYKLTKNNFVSFLPHLGYQCLARINDAGKSVTRDGTWPCILKRKVGNVPDFDVFELPERLHDVLSRDAHKAEA